MRPSSIPASRSRIPRALLTRAHAPAAAAARIPPADHAPLTRARPAATQAQTTAHVVVTYADSHADADAEFDLGSLEPSSELTAMQPFVPSDVHASASASASASAGAAAAAAPSQM